MINMIRDEKIIDLLIKYNVLVSSLIDELRENCDSLVSFYETKHKNIENIFSKMMFGDDKI